MTKQPNIKLAGQVPADETVVYLLSDIAHAQSIPLTKPEQAYLLSKLETDEKCISINSYFKWNFVVMLPENPDSPEAIEKIRMLGSDVCKYLLKNKTTDVFVSDFSKSPKPAMAFAEGIVLSAYRFNKYFTDRDKKEIDLNTISLVSECITDVDVYRLNTLCEAVYLARDIVNEPLSHMSAHKLAEKIQEVGQNAGIGVEVFDKKRIEALRMGGLLAVNRGSIDPPSFSIMTYKPANAINEKPYVVVGKGIVFDTGGLSLKPTQGSMDSMKSDKAGAAAACAILFAVAKAQLPLYVIALIPATDNRPGENAYAPQDVITMYDGTTVEVLNTDAEGRMILADALAYAKKYEPELVIDLATLTGAAVVAVGTIAIAAMSNNSACLETLKQSGQTSYERLVELPLWEEYGELIKSDVADLKNIGGRFAGTITAGKFLEHFTDYPWIHLDIAGTAYLDANDSYRGKAATGSGVRLLFDFFSKKCNS